MDIMKVLRTGMNMSISPIHIWICSIMREVEFLLIASQNKDCFKAKIDKPQWNIKSWLDINGWGKVIHWELYKKLKFGYTAKWYMHTPESILEIDSKNPLVLQHTNGSRNTVQENRPMDN